MGPHTIVTDLGYGDAGKGTIVDWLCATRGYHAVIRYNGGAQAGHNVVTPDGRHHTFAQFGAGTFTPGVTTHLAKRVLVEPFALITENTHLESLGIHDALARLTIHQDALITTEVHRAANHARELARGNHRHGSCGMGIGETTAYSIKHQNEAPRVRDCLDPTKLRTKLTQLASRLGQRFTDLDTTIDVYAMFARHVTIVNDDHVKSILDAGPTVFEGAQGVLLDEWAGFHPHTTWSTTTTQNAEELLRAANHTATRLGVVRAYTTRHGPGPFVAENPKLTSAFPEPHNGTGTWQGSFRVGDFDAPAHRYAIAATGGIDKLAVTHIDRIRNVDVKICTEYEDQDKNRWQPEYIHRHDLQRQEALTRRLQKSTPIFATSSECHINQIEKALKVPVAIESHGPTHLDKKSTHDT